MRRANGGVACDDSDVYGGWIFLAGLKPGKNGPWRIAVGSEDERCDALRDLGFGEGIGVESFGGVVVNVDEAGSEHKALGVENFVGFGGLEVTDFGDARAGDAEVGLAERSAGAVGELGVDDD